MVRIYKLLPIVLTLTGCIPVEDVDINKTSFPCFDGWQYDLIGRPMINPDTGEQLTCE